MSIYTNSYEEKEAIEVSNKLKSVSPDSNGAPELVQEKDGAKNGSTKNNSPEKSTPASEAASSKAEPQLPIVKPPLGQILLCFVGL